MLTELETHITSVTGQFNKECWKRHLDRNVLKQHLDRGALKQQLDREVVKQHLDREVMKQHLDREMLKLATDIFSITHGVRDGGCSSQSAKALFRIASASQARGDHWGGGSGSWVGQARWADGGGGDGSV